MQEWQKYLDKARALLPTLPSRTISGLHIVATIQNGKTNNSNLEAVARSLELNARTEARLGRERASRQSLF